jgi:IclR family acetate operon transcriptional repressor
MLTWHSVSSIRFRRLEKRNTMQKRSSLADVERLPPGVDGSVPAGSAELLSSEARTATDRSLAILDAILSATAPMNARMIGSALDLPKATVHRLLGALEDKGLLAKEPVSGGYVSGPALCEMAFKILGKSAASSGRHAVLAGLAAAIGETCNLGILDGHEARYIDRVEASHSPLKLDFRPGSRVPLNASAMGKLFLSQMSEVAFHRHLFAVKRVGHTPATLVAERALRDAIADVKQAGYATDDEEYIVGVNCLSVLVPVKHARHLVALAVQAPKSRKNLAALRTFLPLMQSAAEKLAAIFDEEIAGRS